MNAQCSPHCRANAFISDTLNGGGLRLYPFTPLFNSYKPANLPCISMSGGKRSVKAGVCWHGSDGVMAKNTFKIGGGPSSLLSSGRSTPQPLNSSFIPAFITIRALSSSTSSSSFFLFFFPPQEGRRWQPNGVKPQIRKMLPLLLVKDDVLRGRT